MSSRHPGADVRTVTRYVAFLRAVNTPSRTIKMERISSAFSSVGLAGAETFLASGNVIFDAHDGPGLVAPIEAALLAEAGFQVPVFLRSADEVIAAADRRPFEEDRGEVEISFLLSEPDPVAAAELAAGIESPDRLAVIGREVYWQRNQPRRDASHKEADVVRILGMPTTQRSARTVRRIADRFLR